MNPIYVPLLSALAGAVIGAGASVITICIQTWSTERRERFRHAGAMALEEYKMRIASSRPGTPVLPFPVFLHYHLQALDALEQNDLTPERLRKITDENVELIVATAEIEKEMKKRTSGITP
jgi:hypothetical protein